MSSTGSPHPTPHSLNQQQTFASPYIAYPTQAPSTQPPCYSYQPCDYPTQTQRSHAQSLNAPTTQVLQLPYQPYPGQVIQTTTTMPGQQQQSHIIVLTQSLAAPHRNEVSPMIPSGQAKCFGGMGVTQVLIGIVCVLFNIIYAIVHSVTWDELHRESYDPSPLMLISPGIWVGLLFVITGSFGIVISKKRTGKGLIVTFMILSILATGFTWVIFSLGMIAAFTDAENGYYCWHIEYPYHEHCVYVDKNGQNSAVAFSSMLVILSFVEFIIAITSAAICCGALCCKINTQNIATGGGIPYTQLQSPLVGPQHGQQTYGAFNVQNVSGMSPQQPANHLAQPQNCNINDEQVGAYGGTVEQRPPSYTTSCMAEEQKSETSLDILDNQAGREPAHPTYQPLSL